MAQSLLRIPQGWGAELSLKQQISWKGAGAGNQRTAALLTCHLHPEYSGICCFVCQSVLCITHQLSELSSKMLRENEDNEIYSCSQNAQQDNIAFHKPSSFDLL